MADTKISALPASTTPLAGTEVLPIVQSSATKQVSVANLTAGRAISATELTLTTGNLIVSNGKGIDFSATPGTGTSELLADYEEGTWTPADASGAGLTFTLEYATYTKVGRLVTLNLRLVFPTTVDASDVLIAGLPFAAAAAGSGARIASMPTFVSGKTTPSTGQIVSDTQFRLYDYTLNRYTNVGLTGASVIVLFSYIV